MKIINIYGSRWYMNCEEEIEMHNVDTISLTMTFRRYTTGKQLDWNYIYKVQSKIMKKLVLYEKDKQNREREIRYNRLCNDNKYLLTKIRNNSKRKNKTIYWHRKI